MFLRRTLAQLMAAAALLPAGLLAQARRPVIAHRLRLVRRPGQAAADLGRHSRLPARAFHLRRRQRLWRLQHRRRRPNSARPTPRRTAIAGYNRLRDSVAHLAVWDDHDYGLNDGGGDFPHKAVSKDLFLEFWKVPADDVAAHPRGHLRFAASSARPACACRSSCSTCAGSARR